MVGVLAWPRPTLSVTMSIITVTAYHNCPGSKGITASYWRKKADIYMDCQWKARRFGVKHYVVLVKLV
jgi:3D (Asp-Asp-Asp) domain-containing protein